MIVHINGQLRPLTAQYCTLNGDLINQYTPIHLKTNRRMFWHLYCVGMSECIMRQNTKRNISNMSI